jgi:hypothetical protein
LATVGGVWVVDSLSALAAAACDVLLALVAEAAAVACPAATASKPAVSAWFCVGVSVASAAVLCVTKTTG